jgi:hypothetical protein
MSDLAKLIKRLEKATDPDRWLDAAVVVALDIRPDWLKNARGELWVDDRGAVLFRDECFKRRGPGNPSLREKDVPEYTASLDAALTLVPDNTPWMLTRYSNATIWAEVGEEWQHQGATPALALCIAALKARVALACAEREDERP